MIIYNLRYSILQDLQGIRTVDGGWGLKGAMGIWAGLSDCWSYGAIWEVYLCEVLDPIIWS